MHVGSACANVYACTMDARVNVLHLVWHAVVVSGFEPSASGNGVYCLPNLRFACVLPRYKATPRPPLQAAVSVQFRVLTHRANKITWCRASQVTTAAAMLGALVMPHNIYLHSALVQSRKLDSSEPTTQNTGTNDNHNPAAHRAAKKEAIMYHSIEGAASLVVAVFINLCVMNVFAKTFYNRPDAGTAGLSRAGECATSHDRLCCARCAHEQSVILHCATASSANVLVQHFAGSGHHRLGEGPDDERRIRSYVSRDRCTLQALRGAVWARQ